MLPARIALAAGLGLASAAVVVIACSEREGTLYGQPSGLRSSNLPGEAGAEPVSCGASVDLGIDGGPVAVDGGPPCAVSFKRDIFPAMTPDGAWKCSSAGKCHGGTQPPVFDGGSAAGSLASIAPYTINGVKYLTDGGDPRSSSFLCNVSGGCGSPMPIAPGRPLTTAEVCRIETWLRCGAPNN